MDTFAAEFREGEEATAHTAPGYLIFPRFSPSLMQKVPLYFMHAIYSIVYLPMVEVAEVLPLPGKGIQASSQLHFEFYFINIWHLSGSILDAVPQFTGLSERMTTNQ